MRFTSANIMISSALPRETKSRRGGRWLFALMGVVVMAFASIPLVSKAQPDTRTRYS